MKGDKDKGYYFIDSNIWLYSFIESDDHNKSVISKSIIKSSDIILSVQVINEVCINLIRKANFSENMIQELVAAFYNKYNVVEMDKEILLTASKLREGHKFSFWDSIIFASALHSGAVILYSEDMDDSLVIEKTRIVNPFK